MNTDREQPIGLDRELRRLEKNQLGSEIGNALANNDPIVLAYCLGRLDETLTRSDERGDSSLYRTEVQLRNAVCAGLNIFPTVYDAEPPEPATAQEVEALSNLAALSADDHVPGA